MRNILSIITALLFCSPFVNGQVISNGGFEEWEQVNGYEVPKNWITLAQLYPFFGASVLKSTQAKSGNFCADVKNSYSLDSQELKGFLLYGTKIKAVTYTKITGWYMLNQMFDDSAGLYMAYYTATPSGLEKYEVTYAAFQFFGTSSTWRPFFISILSDDNFTARVDSFGFIFSSSYKREPAEPNTHLYVDDVVLTGSVGVKNELIDNFTLMCFPQPANDILNVGVNLKVAENLIIQIFNLNGKLVYTMPNTLLPVGTSSFNISTADFSSGIYQMRISGTRNNKTIKIVVSH